jgi:cytochrome c-type biogenesis protein CcmE
VIKAKHQRLVLAVVAGLVLLGAGLVASWALRSQASYFYLPSQLVAANPLPDRNVRLGGMVEEGSLATLADGVSVRFAVTDNEDGRVLVHYSGILPDLFVEGSGVVAEGTYGGNGRFSAVSLLAKHDENYVPRELEGLHMEQGEIAQVAERGRPGQVQDR